MIQELHFLSLLKLQIGEDKDLSVMSSVELKKVFPNKKVRGKSVDDKTLRIKQLINDFHNAFR